MVVGGQRETEAKQKKPWKPTVLEENPNPRCPFKAAKNGTFRYDPTASRTPDLTKPPGFKSRIYKK